MTPEQDPKAKSNTELAEQEGNGHVSHPADPSHHEGHKHLHPHHGHHKPTRTKRTIKTTGAIVLLTGMIAAGIVPRMKQTKKLQVMAASSENAVILVNETHPVITNGADREGMVLPGSVQGGSETVISPRTSGYIKTLLVDIGSRVKAGQLLAEIESPEVDTQLDQAVAETARAHAGTQQASADKSRLEAAMAQAKSDAAKAQAGVDTAESEVAHAHAREAAAHSAETEATARILQAQKHLAGKQADLSRAKARRDLALKTVTRWRELERGGAVSGQELDEAESAYEQSQASVTSAQADVDSTQADLSAAQAVLMARKSDIEAAIADTASSIQRVKAAQAALESSRQQIQAAMAGVQAGTASVKAASALLNAASANTSRYRALRSFERVMAPFDGVITARNVDIGTLVGPGASALLPDPAATVTHNGLFTLARTDLLRVLVNIPQTQSEGIHVGEPATVEVSELPGQKFMGQVARVSGALDSSSRTIMAEVWIRSGAQKIRPGMYTQVHFKGANSGSTIRVPANTLLVDGQGVRIATVTQTGTVHFKQVVIGRDLGKEAEIAQGLDGTETLIADPGDMLAEGQRVEAVNHK